MDTITLTLEKRNSKNQEKLQKFAFLLAGFIFAMNLLEYSSARDNGGQFFKIIYFSAYLLGGLTNIATAIFYDRIKSDKLKENITRWLNALTGLLLLFDAAQKFALGKIAMPVTLSAAGFLYLFISYKWTKLKNRRLLVLSDDYIKIRRRWFETRKIPILSLSKISLAGDRIDISLKNGKSYKLFLGKNEQSILKQFEQKIDEINKKLER